MNYYHQHAADAQKFISDLFSMSNNWFVQKYMDKEERTTGGDL